MRPLLSALALLCALPACLPAEIRVVREEPLRDGLTFVRGGGGNSLVLVRGGQALVFDPKSWPWERAVLDVVRRADARTEWVVDSHLHFDHTQANAVHAPARIAAAPRALEELDEAVTVSRRLPHAEGAPTVAIGRVLRLNIGGEPVVARHPQAPAHTDGDVYLWLPRQKVLATGDLFDNGYYPHIDPLHGGSFVGYLAALEELCGYDAEIVLPGHGAQATKRELLAYRDFVRGLRDAVVAERRAGLDDAQIVAKLTPPQGEPYRELGVFSSRKAIVTAFVRELPR